MITIAGMLTRPLLALAGVPRELRNPLPLLGLVLPLLAAICPLRLGVVSGRSMEPTLRNRSPFTFDRSYYRTHPIRRGDIVVVRDSSGTWIKRVYAVGGDEFLCWKEPREGFVRHDPIAQDQGEYFTRLAAVQRRKGVGDCRVVRLKVPKGSLFVIGDGAASEDSRMRGYVRAEYVIGRVTPLPGQDLGTVPVWVELSSPRAGLAKVAADRKQLGMRPFRGKIQQSSWKRVGRNGGSIG